MRVSASLTLCYRRWLPGLLAGLAACQPQAETATTPTPPPTGHYTGTLVAAGRAAELRATLEIRHPSPGHYDAELLVSAQPALSFVADIPDFKHNTLQLTRPGWPGEVLTLQQQGSFWRGTLAVDTSRYTLLLVRRGPPEPTMYRVREVTSASPAALQFAPADESTEGPAIMLVPDSASGPAAAQWADALARQGVVAQLQLPESGQAEAFSASWLRHNLELLRSRRGIDSAQLGLWLVGPQATRLPAALADTAGSQPPLAFAVLLHPPPVLPRDRVAWQQLGRTLPLLALYGPGEAAAAASLRAALGRGRGGQVVRRYPATPAASQQMQADVVTWLHELATSRRNKQLP